MSEVKGNETKEMRNPDIDNYRNIQPEQKKSDKEVKDYWDSEFKNAAEAAKTEATDNKVEIEEYFDDNDVKYREGDYLLPNIKYEINGYQYKTDEKGRPVSAEGKLRIRDTKYNRNMEKVREKQGQEYRKDDDRGHLIGHQFGGSDKLENLVPMDSKLNQGDFAKLEYSLANAVGDGAKVFIKVEPRYDGDSSRPSEFRVSYSVNGDKDVVVFKNGSGEKNNE